jgi:hypothetical protein
MKVIFAEELRLAQPQRQDGRSPSENTDVGPIFHVPRYWGIVMVPLVVSTGQVLSN